MKKIYSLLFLFLGLLAWGQENIVVDNSQLVADPLMKRFGVNIPASTSFEALTAQEQAITELNLRYARVSTGWGEAGLGLYDADPVTLNSNQVTYDFSRIDAIVDMLNRMGIQSHFATRCPAAFASKSAGVPEITSSSWSSLWEVFASHWIERDQRFLSYEVLDGVGDNSMFAGSNEEYAEVLAAAYKGIIAGEGRSEWLNPKIYPAPSPTGEYNGSLINLLGDKNMKGKVKGLASRVVGIDEFIDRARSFNSMRDKANGTFDWETMISDYRAVADPASDDNVNNVGVISFFKGIEEALLHSDVTKVYVCQLIDGTDGSKGLLTATGGKSPLYHALKLYNQMPLDRRALSGAVNLKAMASGDRCNAALVAWNPTDEAITANLTLNNIDFTNGTAMLYVLGSTVKEENLGKISNKSISKSVSVPAQGCVFVMVTNEDDVVDNLPVKTAIADMHYWWFKFTEGWAWHAFDPQTMTAYVGDRNSYLTWGNPDDCGKWGATNFAVDLKEIPASKKLLIKFEQAGDKPSYADDNSKMMIRVSYMTEFIDEEASFYLKSYNYNTDWCDKTNYVYNHLGSQPDAYPNSGGEPFLIEETDFTTEGGWILDLGKNDPGLWEGQVRLIFYLQNPNAHANGTIVKFQVTDPEKTGIINPSISGIENVTMDKVNKTDVKLYGNTIYADGEVKSMCVYNLAGGLMIQSESNTIDASILTAGAYVVVVKFANGEIGSAKIVK